MVPTMPSARPLTTFALRDVLHNATSTTVLPWPELLAAAERHGVLPRLALSWLRPDSSVPLDVRALVRERLRAHQAHALSLCAELIAVQRLLQDGGVDVLALKGPALSSQLYGEPTVRVSRDLDLLVEPATFARAHDILVQNGYAPEFTWRGRRMRALLQRYHDFAFTSPAGSLIELHWTLAQTRYAVHCDVARMFRDSVTIDVLGSPVRVFSPDDLLLFLALHGARHQWLQLDLVCDVAALLATATLDLHIVRQRAAAAHLSRMLELALLLAEAIDPHLPRRAKHDATLERLSLHVVKTWDETLPAGPLKRMAFDLRVRERWRDRARIAFSTVFAPGLSDWLAVPLPDPLFPLYHVVRPFRLVTQRLLQPRELLQQRARNDG